MSEKKGKESSVVMLKEPVDHWSRLGLNRGLTGYFAAEKTQS